MSLNPRFSAFLPGKTPGKARPVVTRGGSSTYMPAPYMRWMQGARLVLAGEWARQGGDGFRRLGGRGMVAINEPLTCVLSVVQGAPKTRPRSGSWYRELWKTPADSRDRPFPWVGTRGDADNIAGSILDALTAARVIRDDAIIGSLTVTLYATHRPAMIGALVDLAPLACDLVALLEQGKRNGGAR